MDLKLKHIAELQEEIQKLQNRIKQIENSAVVFESTDYYDGTDPQLHCIGDKIGSKYGDTGVILNIDLQTETVTLKKDDGTVEDFDFSRVH